MVYLCTYITVIVDGWGREGWGSPFLSPILPHGALVGGHLELGGGGETGVDLFCPKTLYIKT
jgi:hypothetical protein